MTDNRSFSRSADDPYEFDPKEAEKVNDDINAGEVPRFGVNTGEPAEFGQKPPKELAPKTTESTGGEDNGADGKDHDVRGPEVAPAEPSQGGAEKRDAEEGPEKKETPKPGPELAIFDTTDGSKDESEDRTPETDSPPESEPAEPVPEKNAPGTRDVTINGVTKKMQLLKADSKGRAMIFDTRTNEWRPAESFQRNVWGIDDKGDAKYLRENDLGVGYGNSVEEQDMFKYKDPNHLDRKQDAMIRGLTAFAENLPKAAEGAFDAAFGVTQAAISDKPMSFASRAFNAGLASVTSVNEAVENTAHEFNVSDPLDPRLKNTLYGAERQAQADGFGDGFAMISAALPPNVSDPSQLSDADMDAYIDALKQKIAAEKARPIDDPVETARRTAAVRTMEQALKGTQNARKERRQDVREQNTRVREDRSRRYADIMNSMKNASPAVFKITDAEFKGNERLADNAEFVRVNGTDVPMLTKLSDQKRLLRHLQKEKAAGNIPPNEARFVDEYMKGIEHLINNWNDAEIRMKENRFRNLLNEQNDAVALWASNGEKVDLKKMYSTNPDYIQKWIGQAKRRMSAAKTPEGVKSLENLVSQMTANRDLLISERLEDSFNISDPSLLQRKAALENFIRNEKNAEALKRLVGDQKTAELMNKLASDDTNEVRAGVKEINDAIRSNVGGYEVFAGDATHPFNSATDKSAGTSGTGPVGKVGDAYYLANSMKDVASGNGKFAISGPDAEADEVRQIAGRYENVRMVDIGGIMVPYSGKHSPKMANELAKLYEGAAQKAQAKGDISAAYMYMDKAKLQRKLNMTGGDPKLLASHLEFIENTLPYKSGPEDSMNPATLTPEQKKIVEARRRDNLHTMAMEAAYWNDKTGKGTYAPTDDSDWYETDVRDLLSDKLLNNDNDKLENPILWGIWKLPKDPKLARSYLEKALRYLTTAGLI